MKHLILIIITLLAFNCTPADPNKSEDGLDAIERNTDHSEVIQIKQSFTDTMYLSAYSEIYSHTKLRTIPLTVTLSIRSGSFTDTTIINKISYYDTNGKIIKEYLKKPVILKPMQSIDYIVPIAKESENTPNLRGGAGAHFIVDWGAKYNTQPIMQCVMHGFSANHSVSFMVPGKSIAVRNIKR
ncbi:MAG: hypothetical protein ACJA1A_002627 [Saprospiraceae bacterium]|jgi:hypothetical protein